MSEADVAVVFGCLVGLILQLFILGVIADYFITQYTDRFKGKIRLATTDFPGQELDRLLDTMRFVIENPTKMTETIINDTGVVVIFVEPPETKPSVLAVYRDITVTILPAARYEGPPEPRPVTLTILQHLKILRFITWAKQRSLAENAAMVRRQVVPLS